MMNPEDLENYLSLAHYEKNEDLIRKIQVRWRGYRVRKIVEYIKIEEQFKSQYFTQEDYWELLSKEKFRHV